MSHHLVTLAYHFFQFLTQMVNSDSTIPALRLLCHGANDVHDRTEREASRGFDGTEEPDSRCVLGYGFFNTTRISRYLRFGYMDVTGLSLDKLSGGSVGYLDYGSI